MVLARPDERETWPDHFSLRLFMMVRRSSCGPIACSVLAQISTLVTRSLYETHAGLEFEKKKKIFCRLERKPDSVNLCVDLHPNLVFDLGYLGDLTPHEYFKDHNKWSIPTAFTTIKIASPLSSCVTWFVCTARQVIQPAFSDFPFRVQGIGFIVSVDARGI